MIGMAAASPPHPASAESYAQKASTLREELANKKAQHDALLQKSSTLNAEVSTLKKNLVKVSGDLRESEESLTDTEQKLQDLKEKKTHLIATLYKDQTAMGGFVSAVKKYSQTSTPDMLMQGNPVDASRAGIVMKSVMPRLQEQSNALKAQLEEIRKVEADISDQQETVREESNKLNKQQNSLSSLLQQRSKLYKSTENERLSQEKEVERLTRESKNLEDLMSKLKEKPKRRHKEESETEEAGNAPLPPGMVQPVHGRVAISFGQQDELGAPSRGITFSTRPGASVVTPLAGTVKFAGPFQKYKQILIVEHDGGYHSLIAGLSHIDTVVGASLAAGEPVGTADNSGSPKVYYELRRNGKPINPQKSLLAQSKQEKG